MGEISLREALGNALRYWERGRIFYNLALVLIVLAYFGAGWPVSMSRMNVDLAQALFLMAVLANVAYCAAYIPDVLAQLSDLRPAWLRFRWVLFVIGLTFAGIITRFIASGMFAHAG